MKLTPLAILALVSLAVPVGAVHCTTWSTSEPEVTLPVGLLYGTMIYVDNDPCQPGCLFSVWYYEEANGIPGLQRGDEVVDDTCHGMIESDGWLGP